MRLRGQGEGMKIGLHDADKTRFPNLTLMKLSAWHKAQGDKVEWFLPLAAHTYDKVYSSKVFSWTPEEPTCPNVRFVAARGMLSTRICPTKSNISGRIIRFIRILRQVLATRGCIRSCPWCIVPEKEGNIRAHASIESFLRADSKEVVLMDNNILAVDWGIYQLETAIDLELKVDCNQGLDARIIAENPSIARLLSKVRWLKSIRLACDHKSQMEAVEKTVTTIRKYSGKKGNFSCYVLVKDIDDALERVEFLRGLGVDPFAQPYREPGSKQEPAKILKHFARWVNRKWIFKAVSWADYLGKVA